MMYCIRSYNMLFKRNTALGRTVWCIVLGRTIQFLKGILHSIVQYDVLHSDVQYRFLKRILHSVIQSNVLHSDVQYDFFERNTSLGRTVWCIMNAKIQSNADCLWWHLQLFEVTGNDDNLIIPWIIKLTQQFYNFRF